MNPKGILWFRVKVKSWMLQDIDTLKAILYGEYYVVTSQEGRYAQEVLVESSGLLKLAGHGEVLVLPEHFVGSLSWFSNIIAAFRQDDWMIGCELNFLSSMPIYQVVLLRKQPPLKSVQVSDWLLQRLPGMRYVSEEKTFQKYTFTGFKQYLPQMTPQEFLAVFQDRLSDYGVRHYALLEGNKHFWSLQPLKK